MVENKIKTDAIRPALVLLVATVTNATGINTKNSNTVPYRKRADSFKIAIKSKPPAPTMANRIIDAIIVINDNASIHTNNVDNLPTRYSLLEIGKGIIDFNVWVSKSIVNK